MQKRIKEGISFLFQSFKCYSFENQKGRGEKNRMHQNLGDFNKGIENTRGEKKVLCVILTR